MGQHRTQRDIRKGRVDVVIVDRIDRLYRNLLGLLRFVKLLRDHEVHLVSVSEGLDLESPWGKVALVVLGVLAEIYLDQLLAETQKGKLQNAKDGYDNASFRFGYCNGRCSRCTDPNGLDSCPLFGEEDRGTGKIKLPHPIEALGVYLIFLL